MIMPLIYTVFLVLLLSCISCRSKDSASTANPTTDYLNQQFVIIFDNDDASIKEVRSTFNDIETISIGSKKIALINLNQRDQGFLNGHFEKSRFQLHSVRQYEASEQIEDLNANELLPVSDKIAKEKAWTLSDGHGVVVAVADDGIDYSHEDLRDSVWKNPGEIGQDENGYDKAANGLDDDSNGYVDDHMGWDFGRNDNDPRPEYFFHQHGTAVGGVISGQSKRESGVTGVAPGASIMPIKFRVGRRWTSLDILRGFKYAVDNGAKIINLSYDIDAYVGDEIFAEALSYVYRSGALIVNSAGNKGLKNPPRGVFDELLLVGSTNNDSTSIDESSNFGDQIDVLAPGFVRSTVPNNSYKNFTGTSFSAAITSGTAALVWSKYPEYNREQVVARIIGTTEILDESDLISTNEFETGVLNAYKALVDLPRLSDLSFLSSETFNEGTLIKILIRGGLDPSSIVRSRFTLFDSSGQSVGSVRLYRENKVGSNTIDLFVESKLTSGQYMLSIEGIVDAFGRPLLGSEPTALTKVVEFTLE
jgi:subtilisin family serine protease